MMKKPTLYKTPEGLDHVTMDVEGDSRKVQKGFYIICLRYYLE